VTSAVRSDEITRDVSRFYPRTFVSVYLRLPVWLRLIRNMRFRLVRHSAVKAKTKEICSDFPNFSMQSYLRPWLLAADLMLWCCGFTSRNNTSIPTLILFVTCPWSFSLRQAKLVVLLLLLHCALASCGTVYCNRSCLGLCVCGCVSLWVCYYDNSKLHASVLTKLGL